MGHGWKTLSLAALLQLAACAATRTDIGGFKDADFGAFKHPAVLADTSDLMWRKDIEDCIASQLTKKGIATVIVSEVIPPTRSTSAEERMRMLQARGVDGVIVIEILEQGGAGWKPWFKAKSRVLEVPTGKGAWAADTFSKGNAFAGFDDVRRSYCEKVVDELLDQDILQHG